jgi:hypothetical protein
MHCRHSFAGTWPGTRSLIHQTLLLWEKRLRDSKDPFPVRPAFVQQSLVGDNYLGRRPGWLTPAKRHLLWPAPSVLLPLGIYSEGVVADARE